jgi:hypothetical protein
MCPLRRKQVLPIFISSITQDYRKMDGWLFYPVLHHSIIVCIEEKLDLDSNYDENGLKKFNEVN